MSETPLIDVADRRVRLLLAISGAAIFALAMGAFLAPGRVFPALLSATFFGLGLPLGAMALLDIHRLTGGSWGRPLRPLLMLCARTLPGFSIALLALAFGLRSLYPWMSGVSPARPEIATYWFWAPGFLLRALIIFGFWMLWLRAVLHERRSAVGAGLGLFLYAVTVSFAAADWAMSIEPGWASSAYGALIAVEQIATILAFTALMRAGRGSRRATSDNAQLLLAAVLGVAYLAFMQFLVIWSGNVPNRIDHFVARADPSALAVMAVVGLLGLVTPFLILVDAPRRVDETWTARAGAGVLAALALNWTWRIGVASHPTSFAWACIAVLAIGAPWLAFVLPRAAFNVSEPGQAPAPLSEAPAPVSDPVIRLRIASPMMEDEAAEASLAKESPAVSMAPIIATAAGIGVTVMAALVMIAVAFEITGRPFAGDLPGPLPRYPDPQLQIAPRAELSELDARQSARLANHAALPIDEAMRRIVARGAQAYAPWTVSTSAPATGRAP